MSVSYRAVNWNRQKRIYDLVLAVSLLGAIGLYVPVTAASHPGATAETMLIRGLGVVAILLLHVILAIGPLARLDRRFLPLLYNRRHLGVAMALVSVAHAGFATFQFHALGNVDPITSLLGSNPDLGSASGFPFELFGLGALAIVLLMAATSHDYWLSALTPPVWKALHMLVYVAYLLLLAHVGFGILQDEAGLRYAAPFAIGALGLGGLHFAAAFRERRADRAPSRSQGWVDLGEAGSIPEGRARIGLVAGERVAVFRHEGRLSAVSNVCKHQNGPLGEGRIVDGCITCPWHGYQYRPADGTSPPPFTDTIPTFHLQVQDGRVLVRERPNPAGTYVEPVPVGPRPTPAGEFYVGYLPVAPPGVARFARAAIAAGLIVAGAGVAWLALAQRAFEPAVFEYGRETEVTGVVRADPYPMIEVERPADASVSRYLVVAAGKHGAQATAARLDGERVRLRGTLAYRGTLTLIEIGQDGEGPPLGRGAAAPEALNLGRFDLVGEIVDGKCYIGVMNPGRGKTHRSCAARCLAGGLPPLLVVQDREGRRMELLMLGPDGDPLSDPGRWAGQPIAVSGRVARLGDLWLLRTDPTSFRKVR